MAAARCPSLVLMLLLSCTCYGAASAAADGKLIHLHFYFHEVRAGAPNATVVSVVSLNKYVSYISLTLLTTHIIYIQVLFYTLGVEYYSTP